jgi:hypothetical protein
MPTPKLSITPWKDPLGGTVCAADADGLASAGMGVLFDFRSSGFAADAATLARATGCSLARCRQELFIAEGDMGLACRWLVSGYDLQADDPVIH